MDPIALYPARRNLFAGLGILAAFALPSLSAAQQRPVGMFDLVSADATTGAFLVMAGWLALLLQAVQGLRILRHLVSDQPVFAADASGFSVMGGRMRPWNEFRSVRVDGVRVNYIFPVRWVRVTTGRSRWRSQARHIQWAFLPGPAEPVARAIANYAAVAATAAAPVAAAGAAPVRPARQASASDNQGPIRRVPTWRERLGRRTAQG